MPAKLNQNTDNQPARVIPAGSCNFTPTFSTFKELAVEDVETLISRSSKKSCPADPIPTSLTMQCLEELAPVFTSMINLSLQSGRFAEDWEIALVTPLLKKPRLEQIKKNLRPVSNLAYMYPS